MSGPSKKLGLIERKDIRRALRNIGRGSRQTCYAEQARKYGVSVVTIQRTVLG